ncbi:conserved hypothetical protein [Chloroherpeton thalassium ATCC 35110]|uniref:DinB-like domain-containing protein n=1 Tax=Chloroherpeton thalassium (strain ATCC 35110 / GB-78) TaxID=517418 RepID=B3QUP0_CHLT3|nr:DinB family protein [Chloroherpeton thalassium]ACF12946.1 conserved hypothetical protein [Chloroherpeton thalassium ATCC 35110]
MNWRELISAEAAPAYKATERLLGHVDENALNWKPNSGENWMTVGQLLFHLSRSCGAGCRGLVTGDWGLPENVDPSKMKGHAIASAERLASVQNVEEAKKLLAEDKSLMYEMLEKCTDQALDTKLLTAPWHPVPMLLGYRMLQCVEHLVQHKGQLFYYLKLQGKPMHTGMLWGA